MQYWAPCAALCLAADAATSLSALLVPFSAANALVCGAQPGTNREPRRSMRRALLITVPCGTAGCPGSPETPRPREEMRVELAAFDAGRIVPMSDGDAVPVVLGP